MKNAAKIDEVNDLIQEHSDKTKAAIERLATLCLQDEACRTPLSISIQSHNHEITKLLVESEEAINFFPTIDGDLLAPVKHTVSGMLNGQNIEATETYLEDLFGPRMCFQRTPLHQACRYADCAAIALLISRNADMARKDILGLTPFELCINFGGASLIKDYLECCFESQRKLNVSELSLRLLCSDESLYRQAIQHGTLDMKAKRFAFNFSCVSWLANPYYSHRLYQSS